MTETRYRLIFEGLDPKAQLKKLIVFFHRELSISKGDISKLLKNPPRVLSEFKKQNNAELSRNALEKLGCRTIVEHVHTDQHLPFSISKRHHKIIRAELSKILRCRANLILFLVNLEPETPDSEIPSMMGKDTRTLEESFRESDTILGIDDSRIIILCFSTGKEGVERLNNKIHSYFSRLLGDDVVVSTGYSLFPEERQSLNELIKLANMRRNNGNGTESTNKNIEQPPPSEPSYSERKEIDLNPLQLCFTKARGRVFNRLLKMDAESLWLGLSQVPQTSQRDFLARLPFDSSLAPTLEEMIATQPEPISNKVSEQHFEATIHQMDLKEGLEEREEIYRNLTKALQQVESLSTLPSIATEVFNIVSNSISSAEDLTRVIEGDPALTSKLLKIVNSAFYGFPQEIGTVKQAVVILGTEEITNIAFGLAAARVFEDVSEDSPYDPKTLWHHSICTALIAQNICNQLPGFKKMGIFTAGLLHDFGKIFLLENYPEIYGQIHASDSDKKLPLFELEDERFGINHASIGEYLAENWNLPETLVEAIAFHHHPLSAPNHSQLAAIVGLADYVYYNSQAEELDFKYSPSLCPELTYGHWTVLQELQYDLDKERLEEMAQEASVLIKENQDILKILD